MDHRDGLRAFSDWVDHIARVRPVIRSREEMFIRIMTGQVARHSDLELIENCPGELTATHRMLVSMRLAHVCPHAEAHAAVDLADLVGVCGDCLFRRNFAALWS